MCQPVREGFSRKRCLNPRIDYAAFHDRARGGIELLLALVRPQPLVFSVGDSLTFTPPRVCERPANRQTLEYVLSQAMTKVPALEHPCISNFAIMLIRMGNVPIWILRSASFL